MDSYVVLLANVTPVNFLKNITMALAQAMPPLNPGLRPHPPPEAGPAVTQAASGAQTCLPVTIE